MSNELILEGKEVPVGSEVWSLERGWGKVVDIQITNRVDDYPVGVRFKAEGTTLTHTYWYTLDGKYLESSQFPSLFLSPQRLVPADAVVIRPAWDSVQKEAKSWTVDKNGEPMFHTKANPTPLEADEVWTCGDRVIACRDAICDEWRESKRLRPEPVKKEPRWRWVYQSKEFVAALVTDYRYTEEEFKSGFPVSEFSWYERIESTREET